MKGIIKKEFAGKVRGFAFNMLSWELVCESMGLPMSDVLILLNGKDQLKAMRVIFYSALVSYAEMHGEEFELTERQVGCHFNVGDEVFTDVMACMTDSMATGKKMEPATTKKKSLSAI